MIRVPRHVLDDMIAHAQEGWPEEICGLVGDVQGLPARAYRVKNIDEQPHIRYLLDPKEQLQAYQEIERRGSMYGIYHSHPATQAEPSRTDRANALDADAPAGLQAIWPGAIYFIVSLRDRDHPEVRAWRIYEEANVEESIEAIDEPVAPPVTTSSAGTPTRP